MPGMTTDSSDLGQKRMGQMRRWLKQTLDTYGLETESCARLVRLGVETAQGTVGYYYAYWSHLYTGLRQITNSRRC